MALKKATPDVAQADEELAERGVTRFPTQVIDDELPDVAIEDEGEDEVLTTEPAAEAAEATSRRSRGATKVEPQQPAASLNLDELPDFQAWKSKMDQRLYQEQQQRQQLEQALQQQQAQQTQMQMAAMQAQLDEADDPNQRQVLINQIAAMQAHQQMTEWQRWQTHVNQRLSAEGLDTSEFNPMAYQGETGALQFELDVAAKKRAKLETELKTARKAAAPETLAEIIQREVAKALQQQGYNQVDLGGGERPAVDDADAFQRDLRLYNTGRMARNKFAEKWGDR